MSNLREHATNFLERAKQMFDRDGDLRPVAIIRSEFLYKVMDLSGLEDKDKLKSVLKSLCRMANAKDILIISLSLISTYKVGHQIPKEEAKEILKEMPPPSQDTKSRAAICVNYEGRQDVGRVSGCLFQFFRREDDGKIVYEEIEDSAGDELAGFIMPSPEEN